MAAQWRLLLRRWLGSVESLAASRRHSRHSLQFAGPLPALPAMAATRESAAGFAGGAGRDADEERPLLEDSPRRSETRLSLSKKPRTVLPLAERAARGP